VRDVVVVLIVACTCRSKSTLVVFQTLMQNYPTFRSCQGFLRHPSFKYFFERIQTALAALSLISTRVVEIKVTLIGLKAGVHLNLIEILGSLKRD